VDQSQIKQEEIFTNEGDSFYLQVKSGKANIRKFKRAHPDIPILIPDLDAPNEEIVEKILNILISRNEHSVVDF